jgi:hypothetical protein
MVVRGGRRRSRVGRALVAEGGDQMVGGRRWEDGIKQVVTCGENFSNVDTVHCTRREREKKK